MFQKKDVIYSETIGVCIVEDIVKLADNRKDTYSYYLLRSAFDKTKKAYIPVENHTVRLRALITEGMKFFMCSKKIPQIIPDLGELLIFYAICAPINALSFSFD